MDTNKTLLPAVAIAQLYRHLLIDTGEETIAPAEGPENAKTLSGVKTLSEDAKMLSEDAKALSDDTKVLSEDAKDPSPSPSFRFLGNNGKQIAILVHYPGEPFLPEAALQFLTSILSACKLNIGDTAIVNTARQPASTSLLKETLSTQQLILFGDVPGTIRNTAPFTIESIEGVSTVSAPALEDLNSNNPESKLLKSRLWQCLKQLFQV